MRRIIHIDMDAFYASVEQRDRPELAGQPVVVGGRPGGRGVVAAASYEARRFGIRSAMPSTRAASLCPQAVFLPPDFVRYRAVSAQLHAIFARFTDRIQPLSLDEAYLDVTAAIDDGAYASATAIAEAIRAAVRTELRLTCSAGIGPNKLVAKIASDANKPDGICVVRPERVAEFLAPLPLRRIPGIGPKTAERLQQVGLQRVADLRTLDGQRAQELFGSQAGRFQALAIGDDDSPVRSGTPRKQVSVEGTFGRDLTDRAQCLAELAALAERCWRRLEKDGRRGRTVTIKVRYGDFSTISRSSTEPIGIGDQNRLQDLAAQLLVRTEAGLRPVRLLGVGVTNFIEEHHEGARQLRLAW